MNRKDLWLPLHPFHWFCLPHSSTAPPISLHFSFPVYSTGTTPGHHPSRFPPVPGTPLPLISGNIPALQPTKENPAEGSPGRGRSGAIRIHTTKPPARRVKLAVRWNLNTQLKRLLSTHNCDTALGAVTACPHHPNMLARNNLLPRFLSLIYMCEYSSY